MQVFGQRTSRLPSYSPEVISQSGNLWQSLQLSSQYSILHRDAYYQTLMLTSLRGLRRTISADSPDQVSKVALQDPLNTAEVVVVVSVAWLRTSRLDDFEYSWLQQIFSRNSCSDSTAAPYPWPSSRILKCPSLSRQGRRQTAAYNGRFRSAYVLGMSYHLRNLHHPSIYNEVRKLSARTLQACSANSLAAISPRGVNMH